MIPEDTAQVETRRQTCVPGGWRDEARSQRHGVNGTESKLSPRGALWRNVTLLKPNFCLRGVRFSFSPDWMSLREIRLMLCGGHIIFRGCMQLPASHRATVVPWPKRVRSAGPYK